MSDEKIELKLKDWLFNAGLLGFINILGEEAKDNGELEIDDKNRLIRFSPKVLENFEYKYFDFFIKRYGKTLTYGKILEFEKYIDEFEENDTVLNDKIIKYINNNITIIKNAFSKTYSSVYPLIENDFGNKILKLEEKLEKLSKNSTIKEIKNNFDLIKKILYYSKKEILDKKGNKKRYFETEDIRNVIQWGWEGVAFLDKANLSKKGIKIIDYYKIYRDFFIKVVEDYIKEDKTEFKLQCINSGKSLPIPTKNKDDKNNMYLKTIQFVGDFFNPSKKLSNVWNFYNDIYVTPIVYLIYSCVPAGFIYSKNGKGIFINANHNVTQLKNINGNIFNIFEENEENKIYRGIFKELELQNQNPKYELADIQVIKTFSRRRIQGGKSYPIYRFNILSKNILFFIFQNFNKLNNFFEKYYVLLDKKNKPKWDTIEYLYKVIIEKILESRNLYSTIDKMCYVRISNEKYKCNFNDKDLCDLLEINIKNIRRLEGMEKAGVETILTLKNITDIKNNAYYFRKEYIEKSKNENKIKGLQYRLQNALRTNNVNLFMDILITAHAYIGKEIHKLFIRVLENEDEFKTLGYAFLIGLLNDGNKENQNEGNE